MAPVPVWYRLKDGRVIDAVGKPSHRERHWYCLVRTLKNLWVEPAHESQNALVSGIALAVIVAAFFGRRLLLPKLVHGLGVKTPRADAPIENMTHFFALRRKPR